MGLVANHVADPRQHRLIRGFLTAGVLDGGPVGPSTKGMPQGGPSSPLLSNLIPDVLDRELERRIETDPTTRNCPARPVREPSEHPH